MGVGSEIGKAARKVGPFILKKEGRAGAKAAEEKAAKEAAPEEGAYNPYAPRAPAAERAADETTSRLITKPTTADLAMITRPFQQRTGIFDYDYKMPVRESGIPPYNPPRGVPQRSLDLGGRQDVYDKMVEGTIRGLPVKDWYEIGPVYKNFIDEFGPEVGNQRFDAFIKAIASTSPRSDVGTNVRNATYYYGQANPPPGTNFLPSSTADFPLKPPSPYGHLAQKLHLGNIEKTLFGEGFDPVQNRKPLSFEWNFKGDPNMVTVDTHAFRAPAMHGADPNFLETSYLNEKGATPRNIQKEYSEGQHKMEDLQKWGAGWQSRPRNNEYAYWENYYQRIAKDLGITPREAQAASWVGNGRMTGLESAPKSIMDFVEERILKTAKERNMEPADVWREAIRGVRPLTMLEDKSMTNMPGMSAVG